MKKSVQPVAFIARGLTQGGVGRFVTSVLAEWNQSPPRDKTIVVFTDEKKFITRYSKLKVVYIPKAPKLLWDNFLLLIQLRNYRPQSVMYTKNVIPITHLLSPWKKIVVVYDLGFFYPELKAYKRLDTIYMKLMTRFTLRFANTIVAISKFTKSEIIKFLNIPEHKIEVAYLGVGREFHRVTNKKQLTKVINKYQLQLPFIFYSGSLSPRKNILRLVQAFHNLLDKVPHHLYLASGRRWNSPQIEQYIHEHQLSDRIHLLPHLPEQDLICFYSLASAFVYPSLYEGFGLPIIEAQACGCPVVVSNTQLYFETAREKNAVPVNPESTSSITGGIKKAILTNVKPQSFNNGWDVTANKYLEILCR